MEKLDLIAAGRSVILTLKVVGFWHYDTKWFPIYRIYGIILQLLITDSYILFLNIYLFRVTSLTDLTESLFMTLTETAVAFKAFNIFVRGPKIANLFKNFENEVFQPQSKEEYDCIKNSSILFQRFKYLYISVASACIVAGFASSIFAKDYKLPYPIWLPFDWKTPNYFWHAYSYEFICMIFTCAFNANLDLLNNYALFQVQMYFELICMRFEKVGYAKIENKKELERMILKNLIDISKTHQLVTSFAKITEDFITLPIFVQTTFSSIAICITAYELHLFMHIFHQKTSPINNTGEFLSLLYLLIALTVQIFLPCFYGDLVTYKSSLLANAIYNSNWYNLPIKCQKFVSILMENFKVPKTIKGGKLYIIGLDAFTNTMRKAYSFFAVLKSRE